MAISKKEQKLKRLEALAKSVAGHTLVEWLEEFVQFHADVRNISKDGVDVRREAVILLERDIITPLRGWQRENTLTLSGEDME